ncbi:MAG TPA: phosphotransferase [Gaiellaceae bacterium]|nr:phosphotransferase [Gaiellaceae bacterium]
MTDDRALVDYVTAQRWFGSKTRDVVGATVVDAATLRPGDPPLELQLVEIRFDTGTHDTYQMVAEGRLDAIANPDNASELLRQIRQGARLEGREGTFELEPVARGLAGVPESPTSVQLVATEQSNSSVVFDEALILKVFRRLEPGVNPELELLRFLTDHGFEHIAPLAGWYAYAGEPMDVTLGILQRFVPGGIDGWELALDTLGGRSAWFHGELRRLGEVTGDLHTLLGSDSSDPSFAPEQTSAESLGLLMATVDEDIESIFFDLPDDEPALEPLRGRGEEVRERLRLLTSVGGTGRVIRHHGDFHLGQTLHTDDGWVLLDFEGEPARTLPERRRKRSPLRDVAGMLRSFAYVASAGPLLRGVEPPPGWEAVARAEFLDGYQAHVDPSLVPSGASMDKLLQVFELEKAVYELRYELSHRPDWIQIPVAGIVRMLEEEVPV